MTQKKEPSGLGGWLILPMLGLMFTPLRIGVALVVTFLPIFTEGYWEILTTPGSEAYHALWAPLIIFEIIGNLFFLLGSIVLLVLFFKKHCRFPKLMIIYLLLNVAYVGGDYFLSGLIPAVAEEEDPESIKELVRAVVAAAVWIPYFIKSERVKNTFTKGFVAKDPQCNVLRPYSLGDR